MTRFVSSPLRGLSGAAIGVSLGLVFLGCVEQADEKPTAEDQEYVKKNLLSSAPTPKNAVNADLDGKVIYLGVDVEPTPVEAGKDVKLIHYWKVVSPPGEGWRTFTHVNGATANQYINADHGPVRGKYPVSQWKGGDIIRDEHVFRLPPTWQSDQMQVYVGLWRRTDRMPVKSGDRDDQGRVRAAVVPVKGAAPPPEALAKKYIVRKATKAPKIDGKLDDAAWKTAPSTGAFVNTLTGAEGGVKTEAKMLWDDQNLYIAFENVDTDVWSTFKKRDDKLWQQEAVEVMIDADGNGRSYIELQVAPNGLVFDTYLPEYRKYEDAIDPKRKQFDWNSKAKAGVKVDGTVDKRDDEDKGWIVELAIPLGDVNGLVEGGVKVPPALGETWRLNMFRLDKPKDKGEVAVAWSAPQVGDFHALDKFGSITFANDKGEVPGAAAAPAPAAAAVAAEEPAAPPAAKGGAKAMNEALDGIRPGTVGGNEAKEGAAKSPAAAKKSKRAVDDGAKKQ